MIDYIEDSMDRYPSLFREKIDVLDHMFCTLGNGVDLTVLGEVRMMRVHDTTYKVGGRKFVPFEADPVPLRSIYSWSDHEGFQPFRKLDPDQMSASDAEGIRSYARYFVDCLELTTEEDMIDDHYGLKDFDVYHNDIMDRYRVEALAGWKANIQVFKDFYGID